MTQLVADLELFYAAFVMVVEGRVLEIGLRRGIQKGQGSLDQSR